MYLLTTYMSSLGKWLFGSSANFFFLWLFIFGCFFGCLFYFIFFFFWYCVVRAFGKRLWGVDANHDFPQVLLAAIILGNGAVGGGARRSAGCEDKPFLLSWHHHHALRGGGCPVHCLEQKFRDPGSNWTFLFSVGLPQWRGCWSKWGSCADRGKMLCLFRYLWPFSSDSLGGKFRLSFTADHFPLLPPLLVCDEITLQGWWTYWEISCGGETAKVLLK